MGQLLPPAGLNLHGEPRRIRDPEPCRLFWRLGGEASAWIEVSVCPQKRRGFTRPSEKIGWPGTAVRRDDGPIRVASSLMRREISKAVVI
jgi:hypothetical protein